jgi:hypothetical protein
MQKAINGVSRKVALLSKSGTADSITTVSDAYGLSAVKSHSGIFLIIAYAILKIDRTAQGYNG